MAKPIALFIAGDPVPQAEAQRGDFSRMIREVADDAWDDAWLDVRLDSFGTSAWQPLPNPDDLAGAIFSGSPAMLTERAPWMLEGESYIRRLVSAQRPVLGICFGHQMLGQALGGNVAGNNRGREIGTVELESLEFDSTHYDPVLSPSATPTNRPEAQAPTANASHLESLVRLPPGARVLARSFLEPHAAVRFSATAWGVQFHPEFDAEIIRYYIDARAEDLRTEGLDPEALKFSATDTPYGRSVVKRFIEHAVQPERK